ncbi:MAG: DUF2007 domain-containing protein [Candidatus Eisenbacteria bacterium]
MEHEPSPPERGPRFEVVYTANGEMEAQAIRSALEAAGIPAELKMEAAQQLFAVTVDGLGAVKVMVPADRLKEARSIIQNPATPVEDPETLTGQ